MKKKFEKPSIEVIEFEQTDIISASGQLFSLGVNMSGVSVSIFDETPVVEGKPQY